MDRTPKIRKSTDVESLVKLLHIPGESAPPDDPEDEVAGEKIRNISHQEINVDPQAIFSPTVKYQRVFVTGQSEDFDVSVSRIEYLLKFWMLIHVAIVLWKVSFGETLVWAENYMTDRLRYTHSQEYRYLKKTTKNLWTFLICRVIIYATITTNHIFNVKHHTSRRIKRNFLVLLCSACVIQSFRKFCNSLPTTCKKTLVNHF